mmetsp:Transcript_8918/g.16784  ORF Transcript_8918/g.16784 Transcript_8918/m.16784 type:complete len:336 (-) Transcript_8918:245-1252(-)
MPRGRRFSSTARTSRWRRCWGRRPCPPSRGRLYRSRLPRARHPRPRRPRAPWGRCSMAACSRDPLPSRALEGMLRRWPSRRKKAAAPCAKTTCLCARCPRRARPSRAWSPTQPCWSSATTTLPPPPNRPRASSGTFPVRRPPTPKSCLTVSAITCAARALPVVRLWSRTSRVLATRRGGPSQVAAVRAANRAPPPPSRRDVQAANRHAAPLARGRGRRTLWSIRRRGRGATYRAKPRATRAAGRWGNVPAMARRTLGAKEPREGRKGACVCQRQAVRARRRTALADRNGACPLAQSSSSVRSTIIPPKGARVSKTWLTRPRRLAWKQELEDRSRC